MGLRYIHPCSPHCTATTLLDSVNLKIASESINDECAHREVQAVSCYAGSQGRSRIRPLFMGAEKMWAEALADCKVRPQSEGGRTQNSE